MGEGPGREVRSRPTGPMVREVLHPVVWKDHARGEAVCRCWLWSTLRVNYLRSRAILSYPAWESTPGRVRPQHADTVVILPCPAHVSAQLWLPGHPGWGKAPGQQGRLLWVLCSLWCDPANNTGVRSSLGWGVLVAVSFSCFCGSGAFSFGAVPLVPPCRFEFKGYARPCCAAAVTVTGACWQRVCNA